MRKMSIVKKVFTKTLRYNLEIAVRLLSGRDGAVGRARCVLVSDFLAESLGLCLIQGFAGFLS